MEVRDAVEADAERMAELTGSPADVMRNLVHDRTVRVAVEGEGDDHDPDAVEGFVSFDAKRDTVYVTQIEGTREACERLLDEPTRFAEQERMTVELHVAKDDERLREVAEAAGFREDGEGPLFDGTRTVRYRL